MLNIFICEDDKVQLNRVKKIVEDFILIEELDFKLVLATENPYKVLDEIDNSKNSGIYFLDIDLSSDINGMELAKKIREKDPRGYIIFITTHGEMSYLTFTYKVEAMDFIVKDMCDDLADRVKSCIIDAQSKHTSLGVDKKMFSIEVDNKIIAIEQDKILFFETSEKVHKLKLYTSNRVIEFYGQMREIEEQVDDNFIRIHRSYLINKNYIEVVDKSKMIVVLEGDYETLISSRKIKLLKGLY
ncbi:LytTR family DNA-binding domain-containing protein [uncultured Clostridium sp.]|uniref:LytR/AlgR family response regulator transcription factor n=1 Tax=uncultured Clostridium sp. TaxID=59620 RepID=UPI0026034BE9|nr:LytTR family DNA-binding domain-containing protein [uncultured Clostridium sp.]